MLENEEVFTISNRSEKRKNERFSAFHLVQGWGSNFPGQVLLSNHQAGMTFKTLVASICFSIKKKPNEVMIGFRRSFEDVCVSSQKIHISKKIL